MKIFRPISTIYYGFVLKIKSQWYSRKKRKLKRATKVFLKEKLKNEEFSEEITNKVINNYLSFGEIIFDRKILEGALSIDRKLIGSDKKTSKKA
ncbi:MAG: hypothetical protein KAS63_05550 [Candidatus Heimdallarchaeota archaeon]|nr:hypothetical protein [Candidatus Heimdallarchaeota archaeon]MCK4954803.1 hypothetical protein [Candidatus Heimdallarchaeota archaeon]